MGYIKKKNKITYFEIFFSCLFIFIIFLIISVVFASIYVTSIKISKNAEATSIMTNILENMKKRTFSDFETYIDSLSVVGTYKTIENDTQSIFVNGLECQEKFFGTDIPNGYNLIVKISNTDKNFDLAKDVNIAIYYSIFGKSYNLEMDTLIEREKINEVNVPVINSEYFSFLNIDIDDYDVVPIKYSYDLDSYIITTVGDTDWYNYSTKEWAKVLLFSKEGEISKDIFVDINGKITKKAEYNGTTLNLENYMYVWIPNFSVKDNETYFRYSSGKNAIKIDYIYENNKYLYFYSVADEIEDVSEKCNFNGVSGVWRNVLDTQDEYYKCFTNTKYGPINLH